jgi:hypothetical protein
MGRALLQGSVLQSLSGSAEEPDVAAQGTTMFHSYLSGTIGSSKVHSAVTRFFGHGLEDGWIVGDYSRFGRADCASC